MKVFISWSGDSSRAVATYLSRWLRMLPFSTISTWMSGDAIDPGSRWSMELAQALESTDFGILCLTRGNQAEPWVSFEAGALSKAVEKARVVPYLIGFAPDELNHPLRQFQAVPADRLGTEKLVRSLFCLDTNCGRTDEDIRCSFDELWPSLEKQISSAQGPDINGGRLPRDEDASAQRLVNIEKMVASLSARLLSWESRQADGTARGRRADERHRKLYVYTGSYVPSVNPQILVYDYDDIDGFYDLRNKVYFDTGELNPTHTYGHTWVLVDPRTRSPFKNRRMIERGEPGHYYEDPRSLDEVGILPGMVLEMAKPADLSETQFGPE